MLYFAKLLKKSISTKIVHFSSFDQHFFKNLTNASYAFKTYCNSIYTYTTIQILIFNYNILYQWILSYFLTLLNRPSSLIQCLLTIATECGVGPVTSRVLRGLWTIILKGCYDTSCTWIYGISYTVTIG